MTYFILRIWSKNMRIVENDWSKWILEHWSVKWCPTYTCSSLMGVTDICIFSLRNHKGYIHVYTAFLCIETQNVNINVIKFWSVTRYIGKRNNFWMAYIYPLNYHMYFHFPYAPIYVQKLAALDAMPLCTYGTGNLSFIIKHQLSWKYFYIKEKQYISKTNITAFTWMDNLCHSNWSF